MKKKKVLKVVLIILVSLILVFILSLAAIFQFVIKPHTKELTAAIEQVINDPEFIEEFKQEEISEGLPTDSFGFSVENPTLQNEDPPVEQIPEIQTPETQSPETQTPKQPKKPKEEYKSVYDYAKDNVNPKDLKTGMNFASRIDVNYVLGLLSGGLTVPEKRELKAYLKQRFSGSEISQGIALYNKYSYLLK